MLNSGKLIDVGYLGGSEKFPEFISKLPWFKYQIALVKPLLFPSSKQKLVEFVDWMINGGEVDVAIWTKMFMCSPVSEEFMKGVPDDFKIEPVMITIGSDKFKYSDISKISPYLEKLYKNDYLADTEIRNPTMSLVIRYIAYPRAVRLNSSATEQEIDDILDLLGINIDPCFNCGTKKLCYCRNESCLRCYRYGCACVCNCCGEKMKLEKHKEIECEICLAANCGKCYFGNCYTKIKRCKGIQQKYCDEHTNKSWKKY